MLGTLMNVGTVIAGSTIGLLVHSKLPKTIITIAFQGIGLFTLTIGFTMAMKTQNFLLMVLSIVLGGIIGQALNLEAYIERLSHFLKVKVKSKNEKFTEGFISAFLLFCMGSMTIMGAIEEGLGNRPNLYFAKSVLDLFSSAALATSFGVGVLFSVIPLFIYQGGLTLLAGLLHNVLTEPIVTELTAVGGLILVGLGLTILEIKEIKILNMLPALLISVILSYLFL
ncbi:hypothetical protein U27_03301 [Candidatus Vecturithrix granuli]|uniref:Transport protein n=1 Tax=Vecturithrix granuli TaxID=1499967 RepID=A0A081BVI4_VECG1|nr:hypothetical protein U27_03301 [Candidatus Vecturithrix granuli]